MSWRCNCEICPRYAAIHHKIRDGKYRIYSTRYRVPFRAKLAIAGAIVSGDSIARMAAVQLLASFVHLFVYAGRTANALAERYTGALAALLAMLLGAAQLSAAGLELSYFQFHQFFTLPLAAGVWGAATVLASMRAHLLFFRLPTPHMLPPDAEIRTR